MTTSSNRFALSIATVLLAITVLAACATSIQTRSRLDTSGLTVVTLDEPIVLSRSVPRLAAAARDYAYLGPLEINRMGFPEYVLWLGLASTIDRAGMPAAEVQALALLLDGQPMLLALEPWATDLDHSPYDTLAPLYVTFAARTSRDQLRRISAAASVEVRLVSASGSSLLYRKWQGDWSSWSLLAANE